MLGAIKMGAYVVAAKFPIESLEQMMDFAKKHGYIGENPIVFVGEAAFLEDFAAFLNSEMSRQKLNISSAPVNRRTLWAS